jgi:putative sigma-54 modulation protein
MIMELKIKAIRFDANEKLHEFIEKKLAKLAKANDQIGLAEVTLKVVKPETAKNKSTGIRITVPNEEFFAEKTCDTFEEGVDQCLDALHRQVAKYKEKQRGH